MTIPRLELSDSSAAHLSLLLSLALSPGLHPPGLLEPATVVADKSAVVVADKAAVVVADEAAVVGAGESAVVGDAWFCQEWLEGAAANCWYWLSSSGRYRRYWQVLTGSTGRNFGKEGGDGR